MNGSGSGGCTGGGFREGGVKFVQAFFGAMFVIRQSSVGTACFCAGKPH